MQLTQFVRALLFSSNFCLVIWLDVFICFVVRRYFVVKSAFICTVKSMSNQLHTSKIYPCPAYVMHCRKIPLRLGHKWLWPVTFRNHKKKENLFITHLSGTITKLS